MRFAPFAVAACLLLATSPLTAAEGEKPAYLTHFSDAHTTLLVINDPLPTIQRTLASAELRRVLLEGRFAKHVAGDTPAAKRDPREWWKTVDQNRRWVPREVVIGVTSAGVDSLDHLVRAFTLGALAIGAGEAGEGEPADAHVLRKQLTEELKAVRLSGLRIWMRTRNPEDAAAVFELVGDQLRQAGPGVGLAVQGDAKELRVSFEAKDVVDQETVQGTLAGMGLTGTGDGAEDAKISADMAAAVLAFAGDATLRLAGDGLLLTVGAAATEGKPIDPANLGPTFRSTPADILWSRWDAAPLKDAVRGWWKLWQTWADKPAGKAAAAKDTDDMRGTLRLWATEVEKLADRGAMRMWAGDAAKEGGGLHMLIREEDVPAVAEPLTEKSTVVAVMPASAEAYWLDATTDAGSWLSGTLMQFEDRLETQRLKADFKKDAQGTRTFEAMAAGYYQGLDAFRQLAHHESRQRFTAPMGVIYGSRGKVKRFAMTVTEKDGTERTVGGRDLPAMEAAVLAKARDRKSADAFLHELYAAFVDGVAKAAGGDPLPPPHVMPVDLGLGTPTYGLSGAWISHVSGDVKLRIAIDGDLRLHYFWVDDVLVISTSPRLSGEILAAHKDPAKRLKLSSSSGNSSLTAIGRIPGTTIAAFLEHTGTWIGQITRDFEKFGLRDPAMNQMAEFLSAFGEFGRIIDVAEGQSTDDANRVRTTTARVRFK